MGTAIRRLCTGDVPTLFPDEDGPRVVRYFGPVAPDDQLAPKNRAAALYPVISHCHGRRLAALRGLNISDSAVVCAASR
jgi:hypothetical protein